MVTVAMVSNGVFERLSGTILCRSGPEWGQLLLRSRETH